MHSINEDESLTSDGVPSPRGSNHGLTANQDPNSTSSTHEELPDTRRNVFRGHRRQSIWNSQMYKTVRNPRDGTRPTRLIQWGSMKKWYTKLSNESIHYKRIFKIIYNARIRITVQLQRRGVDQSAIITGDSPLDVKGVIYAIVHLPTSKVYVGQTINSSLHRLKSHWYDRTRSDFRNGHLHEFMKNQPLYTILYSGLWKLLKQLCTLRTMLQLRACSGTLQ
jgi:hypothetical protein